MSSTIVDLPDEIRNDAGWCSLYKALEDNFNYWQKSGYLSLKDIKGANVLDFGGAAGQLAVISLQNGARQATVVDTSLPVAYYETKLSSIKNLRYSTLSIEDYCDQVNQSRQSGDNPKNVSGEFDFVISHTVTEHIQYPATVFAAIHKLLKPGGLFFIVHDNYYHPSGAHDNIMLQTNKLGLYDYLGPKCWENKSLCEFSSSFRIAMEAQIPWLWNKDSEARLTPENCKLCLFYRRTKPWAHIIYQDEFTKVFPSEFFTMGLKKSAFNKITPFQLKQYLIEAGFIFELWERTFVKNTPPKELMLAPYYCNETDLKTLNVYTRCRKAG
jgi:SAM-dependent methyltransferase